MWIAKNKDNGKEYPKKFDSIYDCQKYIDDELKEDLEKANALFRKEHPFSFFFCDRILCYNLGQRRYCDGFDF